MEDRMIRLSHMLLQAKKDYDEAKEYHFKVCTSDDYVALHTWESQAIVDKAKEKVFIIMMEIECLRAEELLERV